MAQWSHADRTVYTKIVYYGPAFGGKTTNLESLHRITDPEGNHKLLSIKTSDDRTLFFDLLPFDLGEILGYQVAMKLFTVPGQVRYDTTRKVVLAGADAVVFVADSSMGRTEQNRWSLQNLRMNMRANGLDPAVVPVTFQFNKQDLPEAASPDEVARGLEVDPSLAVAAVANQGRGVLETLLASTRDMLARLVERADERTRRQIDTSALADHVATAFAPHLERQRRMQEGTDDSRAATTPIVPEHDDLLQRSVQTSVKLGERLTVETARAARLEREAEALRRLSDLLRRVGASFDREEIVDAGLGYAAEVLEATAVSLVLQNHDGTLRVERSWNGIDDPLLAFDEGAPVLRRMVETAQPCLIEDLAAECDSAEATQRLYGLHCALAVPVDGSDRRCLVAYGEQPDGAFERHDVRFMATLAGHLSVGLEKARHYAELSRHRDRLERAVAERTEQLEQAYRDLRGLEQTKDRFLSNLSHEMKSPLTAIVSSAVFLRDYESDAGKRKEMLETILDAARSSQRQLDALFRAASLESESGPLDLAAVEPDEFVRRAVECSGREGVKFQASDLPAARIDVGRLARGVAQLIDNAVKFSPEGSEVELKLRRGRLEGEDGSVAGWRISVLDRGPGVPEEAVERIFQPFEQGGDVMTSKPAGIGVGLYECRAVVRRHGGTVEYRPRRGGGSEFRIVVPLEPVETARLREVAHAG